MRENKWTRCALDWDESEKMLTKEKVQYFDPNQARIVANSTVFFNEGTRNLNRQLMKNQLISYKNYISLI